MDPTAAFLPNRRHQHLQKESTCREKSKMNLLTEIPVSFSFVKERKYFLLIPSPNKRKAGDKMCLWFVRRQSSFLLFLAVAV